MNISRSNSKYSLSTYTILIEKFGFYILTVDAFASVSWTRMYVVSFVNYLSSY